MSAAKLWTRHWVTGHKCMLQEMGPGESEYAGKGFSGGEVQFKRKIHLGISSTCVLIHAPQLLKKVKQGFETRKWGRLYKRVWCAFGRQPFSWSFTQVVSAKRGEGVACLMCRCQRGQGELRTGWSAVSVPGKDGQLERGRQEWSWPWELTSRCGPVVSAGRKQGCRSLMMLWSCSEEAAQMMSWVGGWEKGWSVLIPASSRAYLLWTFIYWACPVGLFEQRP